MAAVSLTVNGHFSHLPHVGCTPSLSIGGTRREEFAELHLHTHQLRHRHNFCVLMSVHVSLIHSLFPGVKMAEARSPKIGDKNDCAEV